VGDWFWQGGTNFGCQNWSGRTDFRGDRFWCDSTTVVASGCRVKVFHHLIVEQAVIQHERLQCVIVQRNRLTSPRKYSKRWVEYHCVKLRQLKLPPRSRDRLKTILMYRMAQNFDGRKYWRIFINSLTFNPSKFSADNLLPFACLPDHFFAQGVIASIRAHAILFPIRN